MEPPLGSGMARRAVALALSACAALGTACADGDAPEEQQPPAQRGPSPDAEEVRAPTHRAQRREEPPPIQAPPGRWRIAPAATVTAEQLRKIEALNDIGYASGSSQAPSVSGVTLHDPEHACPGANFYNSGHEPGAVLMDMRGEVLHRWRAALDDVWPGEEIDPRRRALTDFWRRAHLYENGDVLAIFEGFGIAKLDRNSHVLWKNRCGAHHDLDVMPDGDIFVLSRSAHVVPAFDPEQPILEDFVSILGPDGEEKRRISILQALDRSPWPALAQAARQRSGDILHSNTLAVLDGRRADLSAFQAGNLLISSRPLSFLAILDPQREEIVWTLQGSFREQHDPKVLENGHLLLFDNSGRGNASSVLELDLDTGATVWEYHGTPAKPFHSHTCGTAERLVNGNTLITESDGGRAFEVTPQGETVWEFWNPERAGPDGQFIATLFEVVRLAPAFPLGWRE